MLDSEIWEQETQPLTSDFASKRLLYNERTLADFCLEFVRLERDLGRQMSEKGTNRCESNF